MSGLLTSGVLGICLREEGRGEGGGGGGEGGGRGRVVDECVSWVKESVCLDVSLFQDASCYILILQIVNIICCK